MLPLSSEMAKKCPKDPSSYGSADFFCPQKQDEVGGRC